MTRTAGSTKAFGLGSVEMHEQSETVGRDGKFYNVYGANTPKAGQVLPGEPAYNTLKEAVTAAENRSEQYGHKHNPEGNKMADNKTKETRFNAENPRSQAAYDRAERMYKLEVNKFGNPDGTPSAEGNRV